MSEPAAKTVPAPEAVAAIEAVGLSRRFGPHLALDGLDLAIPHGSRYGLLGANGAGKTTFLRVALGLLLPSRGRVRLNGRCPVREARAVQREVGFVSESCRLYPELRVTGHLRFAGGARGLRGAALAQAVERVVERFSLGGVERRLVGHLSRGYQQRVALALAFLHDPSLVILDEPTAGLDPWQREQLWSVLSGLSGRCTVLISTHDLGEARALCARVAVLHAGRRVAEGETATVLAADPRALFGRASAAGRP